jgi:hypothetical protein
MRPRTHFAFRIVVKTDYGQRQIAASSDLTTAMAAYRTASECWPSGAITLRHGNRVIERSEQRPIASR